jgi:F0F1-type ATP synthase gamma subunit
MGGHVLRETTSRGLCGRYNYICTRLVYRGLLITKSKRFMDQSASDMMNVKLYTVGRR